MNSKILRYFSYLILLLGFLLFFIGGPDYYSSRSFKRIWDIGHILFFALFTFVILQNWSFLKDKNFIKRLIIILPISLISGSFIEAVQLQFNRLPEFGDLWRDVLGVLFAFFFFFPRDKPRSSKILLMGKIILIVLLTLELKSPLIAVLDENIAGKQFPVLSNFETPFESDRWEVDGKIKRYQKISSQGHYCLQVLLTPQKYSGITLKYFPENWQEHSKLSFSVFNPRPDKFKFNFRIHDMAHVLHDEIYQDRYNKTISISSGWNLIELPLKEIQDAPRDRIMDLSKVVNLRIFITNLSEPLIFYIDEVYLE
jgi:hypothetical protein